MRGWRKLGLSDWIGNNRKSSHDGLRESEDFRKNKAFAEPKIPFFSSVIAFPYIGPIRAYYIALFALFALFIVFKSPIIGILAGLLILFIVLYEFYIGSKTTGVMNEVRDTAIALGLGVLVWFGAGVILNTPTPINAIVSCSMLPSYDRGDMIILQGAQIQTEFVEYAGRIEDIATVAEVEHKGKSYRFNGSIYSHCQSNVRDGICLDFFKNPSDFRESHGPLELKYGTCIKQDTGTKQRMNVPCVKETYFEGKRLDFSYEHDLIVYQPKKTDLYSLVGDIIHRARFAINTGERTVYFTKGDNNPVYDFQIYSVSHKKGNSPIEEEQIKGKSLLRVPFIGNFKLFITPQVLLLDEDATGCSAYFVE